jgi:hypothetical protein
MGKHRCFYSKVHAVKQGKATDKNYRVMKMTNSPDHQKLVSVHGRRTEKDTLENVKDKLVISNIYSEHY